VYTTGAKDIDTASAKSRKRRWFKKSRDEGKPPSDRSSTVASSSSLELAAEDEDAHTPLNEDREWGLNDDIRMTLG
jgi:hypothetical protein